MDKARVSARTAPWQMLRLWVAAGVLAIGALLALRPAEAQEELASPEQLQELVGPIALYPDDLVAIVLPASTYPLQIVQAARFLEDRKDDASLKPNEEWDDSIVALLNYPEALKLLNDDLDWTYDLGTAVLNQRADVLSAIQDFRDEAYAAGNLRSDERQTVAREDDTIEIKPADPKVIYIPYYEPERVVVYQPTPVYYYYPRPYPVYYYPYPAHYRFSTGFFWGVNTWFSIGWHSHYVHAYDPFYHGHPYYGWSYYDPFYVRNVYVNVNHYHRYPNYVWQPSYRYGGRPVVRGSEGRVFTAEGGPRYGDRNGAVTRAREGATRAREGSVYRGAQSGTQRTEAAPAVPTQPRTQAESRSRPTTQTEARSQPRTQTEARMPAGATGDSAYRGVNGGMSQARARAMAQGAEGRASPGAATADPAGARPAAGVSPRGVERSTGMPRESSRVAPAPREPAAALRAPPVNGGMSAHRAASGSGYRGNSGEARSGGGNSGGSYRGGGSERAAHSAARHTR